MIPLFSILELNDNDVASREKKSICRYSQIPTSNYINILLFSDQNVYSFICLLP